MDNNLFSLFDEQPSANEKADQDKKNKASKKKSSSAKNTTPHLFLFETNDESADSTQTTDTNNKPSEVDEVSESNSDTTPQQPIATLPAEDEQTIKTAEADTTQTAHAEIDFVDADTSSNLETLYKEAIIYNDYARYADIDPKVVADALPANDNSVADNNKDTIDFDITPPTTEGIAPLPEWELQKKYYTIGEVATLFNVNTSHIRFWSKEFNFRLRTTRKGDRMYTAQDIQKLRLIHELVKVKKHTIKGAKEILSVNKKKVVEKIDLKEQLKDLKALLIGIQNKI